MKTNPSNPNSVFVAAGFIALDMVIGLKSRDPRFYAGGTTGNLLASMAFQGWKSIGLGRLERDDAGSFVEQDLRTVGVDTRFLHSDPVCPTPIVVQKIFKGRDGRIKHSFSWTCPDCGAYLPGYRALLADTTDHIAEELTVASVFFTDRVSRSTINLAKHFKRCGAVIFFEPSGLGDPTLFVEMLKLCDVLKYSDQRAKSFSDFLPEHSAKLEIQTMGEEGLRFRLPQKSRSNRWHTSGAFEAPVVDTAGAGDWTSAGLISKLFTQGRESLRSLTKTSVEDAIEYGQALAALNCGFEGARGVMYNLSLEQTLSRVQLLRGKRQTKDLQLVDSEEMHPHASTRLCPSCKHGTPASIDVGGQKSEVIVGNKRR